MPPEKEQKEMQIDSLDAIPLQQQTEMQERMRRNEAKNRNLPPSLTVLRFGTSPE